MKKTFVLLLAASFTFILNAQVSVSPVFPTIDDNLVLTFDASQGDQGLMDETKDIYAYTGVITDKSTSQSNWLHVKESVWTENRPDCKMVRSATNPNIYTLSFKIKDFYGIASTETVKQLAMVFRNTDASRSGRGLGGADIFYTVINASSPLQTKIVSPAANALLVKKGAAINFDAYASISANLTITDNNTVVSTLNNAKELTTSITAQDGNHTVVFKAVNGNSVDSSQFTYSVIAQVVTAALPINAELGASFNVNGDSLTLVFQAPGKQNIYVVGSFNDYKIDNNYLMNTTADGKYWWIKIGGLTPKTIYTYQFFVDGGLRIADPLSTLILDPYNDVNIPAVTYPNIPAYPTGKTTGFVSVIQSNYATYNWKATNYTRPAKSKIIIYELLVRDFIARHDYQTLIDTLGYLQKLGINAIELMPVAEFDNNESWGYNPTFHNALDKYYGTATKFKEFIDTCHARGIAVIMDVVFNHIWGNSSLANLYPAVSNPYLNAVATHPYSVGVDFNHESEFTQNYVIKCLKTWLTDYKIDGFRFDLAKGFTQKITANDADFAKYDPSRVAILNKYNNAVQTYSPNAYTILELFSDLQEETILANNGMMMWGNMNRSYGNASSGSGDNGIDYVSANARGWNSTATSDKLIAYPESHDEERLMVYNYASGNFISSFANSLKRVELTNTFYYTIPGPKMVWQFGELGYDYSINSGCRVCNKPILWDYYTDVNRRRLFNITSSLMDLKKSYPVFQTGNYNSSDLKTGNIKAFHLSDNDLQVTILGNFGLDAADAPPNFQSSGKWYNFFKGDSINVVNVNDAIHLNGGEYRIYTSKQLKKPAGGYAYFTGVDAIDETLKTFSVSPNPAAAQKSFTVSFSLATETNLSFKITNMLGETVYQTTEKKYTSGTHSEQLNGNLNSGIYFVSAMTQSGAKTFKIFVE